MWREIGATIMLFVGVGCGGQVVDEPGGGDDTGNTNDTANSTDGSATATDETTTKTRLGSCKAGTKRAQATECVWLAEGICYPTWDAACNCVCPTDVAAVTCISDFPEDGIPTDVYCS